VRFADQSLVHEVVRRGIMEALGAAVMPVLPSGEALTREAGPGAGTDAPGPGGSQPGPSAGSGGAWAGGYLRETAPSWPGAPGAGRAAFGGTAWPVPGPGDRLAADADTGRTGLTIERPLTPLGQFRNTFIIAVDDEGIVVIDQHVAHERVLFERILERLTASALPSQRLLVPMILDLPGAGHATLLARAGDLERFGFELEDFGGASVRVSAVPAILKADDIDRTLRALADDLEHLDRGSVADQALKLIAATMACHAAVRAHDPLTLEKMAHILEELRATAYSTVCPHGRPVMFRLGRRELERRFERI
jgi:DNA mismatch repair protein MutL